MDSEAIIANIFYIPDQDLREYYAKLSKSQQQAFIGSLVRYSLFDKVSLLSNV